MNDKYKLKSLLSNSLLILLARIVLGSLFIIASLDKIIDPSAFSSSILNYKVVNPATAVFLATVLPPLELICGLGLVFGLYPRASAWIITALLAIFTIVIITAMIRGLDISCGCFTQDPDADKIGIRKLCENSGMIILGIYLLFVPKYGLNLLDLLSKKSRPSDTK